MKIKNIFLITLCLALTSCISGINPNQQAVQAPTLTDILPLLQAANATGHCANSGENISFSIDCAWTNVIESDRVHSWENLPAWAEWDEANLTLRSVTPIPDYSDDIMVTLRCSTADGTVSDEVQFNLVDCDGGGMIDIFENELSEIPQMNNVTGYIPVDADNVDAFRAGGRIPTFLNPPNLLTAGRGTDVLDPLDDGWDFDLDGITNLDEVIADTNIFVGASNATFTLTSYASISAVSFTVSSGDFDNDGYLDMIQGTSKGASVYLWNPQTDSFNAETPNGMLTNGWNISVADINNDGNLDAVIIANFMLVVLHGNGAGQFLTSQNVAGPFVQPTAVVACDFNNDGAPDAAMTEGGGVPDTLDIYLNAANQLVYSTSYTAGSNPEDIVCSDFDMDNNIDLAVISSATQDIRIFLGNGDGTFALTAQSPIDFADVEPYALTSADFNLDGFLDLAAADLHGNVKIYWGEGNGNFTGPTVYAIGTGVRQFSSADFDGDNDIDLVLYNVPLQALTISINSLQQSGTVGFTSTDYPIGAQPTGVVASDFDGDGLVDAAGSSNNASPALVLMQ